MLYTELAVSQCSERSATNESINSIQSSSVSSFYKCFNLKVELNLSPASFPSHWWIVGLVDIWLSLLSIKCQVISPHCHLEIEFTTRASLLWAPDRFVLVCPIKAITLSNFIIVSLGNPGPCTLHKSHLASSSCPLLVIITRQLEKMGFRSEQLAPGRRYWPDESLEVKTIKIQTLEYLKRRETPHIF